jgi:hypothetical protein
MATTGAGDTVSTEAPKDCEDRLIPLLPRMEKIPEKRTREENTIYDHCLLEFFVCFLVFLPYQKR